MAETITRCPKCHTSFRITEAHLKSAKGAVRCGSCLNIFNARAHLVQNAALETTPVETPKPKPKTKPKPLTNKPKKSAPKPAPIQKPVIEDTHKEDDDILISDDMPLDELDTEEKGDYEADFNDNILYSTSVGSQESNLFEREILQEDDDDEETSDESWALDLIDGAEDEQLYVRKDTSQDNNSADDANHDNNHDLSEDHYEESNYSDYHAEYSEKEIEEAAHRSTTDRIHEPVFTSAEPSLSELEAIIEPDYETAATPQHQFIHAIEPEPVEFSYRKNRHFLESKLLWAPLIGLMSIALVAQVAWLQFDRLNRTEPYRSYYAQACQWLNCTLPPLVNRAEIHAVNLVVRSHPERSNALVVDAVLQNAAAFPQRFPSLDLVFTDMQDQPVAARRFEPREYLGGEMAGKDSMPSKQPIHIALEIADPGPKAVGYRITIAQ
ncbi:DUF3426 domain-containing protein [Teredinibacter haidensis]|uniref:DUF3426 domain-containing protein n=1 Tax=Teredinibacter haidensis TaxID=2731755 RepID=UPI000948E6C6|nr:DUF3426 domain-containing protein [Teredinibacter haidensis]